MNQVDEYSCPNDGCNNSWYSGVRPPGDRTCDPCAHDVSNTCTRCRIILVPFYQNYDDNPVESDRTCFAVGMNPYACRCRDIISV